MVPLKKIECSFGYITIRTPYIPYAVYLTGLGGVAGYSRISISIIAAAIRERIALLAD